MTEHVQYMCMYVYICIYIYIYLYTIYIYIYTYKILGGVRLDTDQLDTTNHSDRCLKAFHCSSAVSGSCSIDSCPNGGHPKILTENMPCIKILELSLNILRSLLLVKM